MTDKWVERDRMLRALGAEVKATDTVADVASALIGICFRQEAELENLRRDMQKLNESIPKPRPYNHLYDGSRSPTPVERRSSRDY